VVIWDGGRSGRASCGGDVDKARGGERRGGFTRRLANALKASPSHDRGRGGRKFPIFRSLKMPSPVSLKAKGKQRATAEDVPSFNDIEDATDSGSSPGSFSDSASDSDPDSDSDSGSSSGSKSESDAKPENGTKEDPPLSRDDLLAYLENMRRRFSKKATADLFADQEEEVLVITSKNK